MSRGPPFHPSGTVTDSYSFLEKVFIYSFIHILTISLERLHFLGVFDNVRI